ncbi:DUF1080 domain-containing protein [bacterium]|nr:DUF1080 domain-containing protein [bacterium]
MIPSPRLLSALILASTTLISIAADWQPLVQNGSKDGWIQRGGKATYEIKGGTVIGRTAPNTPNSFLCTERHYANFILELDYKVDPKMNSGVQIRSHSLKEYRNGQVHGYQVEIDPSDRAWSGGIYDEGRRGWLNNLKENKPAQQAFKQNEWNHYRIEANGPRIRTWINGVPAADLDDAVTPSGFIALQVHGIGKRTDEMEIQWKNIKIKDLGEAKPIRLLEGSSLDRWSHKEDKAVTAGWSVKGNELARTESTGDIYTKYEFEDFEFKWEWKVAEASNSGVKYRMNTYGKSILGLEYQILDDDAHPDAKKREGRRKSASLYDLFPCNSKKALKPVGEWNQSRILAKGHKVQHWLNGALVVEYNNASDEFIKAVAGSKYAKYEKFGQNLRGKIMLQDHHDPVWYRNLTILPLSPADR